MNQKDRILVLRTIKYGESDLIVHGLNALGGRMNFFARGGLKSRKRFAGGVLEATHYIEVSYKVGRATDSEPLHTLLEAQVIREFIKLRSSFERLETALHLLKIVHKISREGVVDSPELFNLLGNALAAAEVSNDLGKLRLHFEVKLLASQGVLPPEGDFQNYLSRGLSQHESISLQGEERRFVEERIHSHLKHYLGTV